MSAEEARAEAAEVAARAIRAGRYSGRMMPTPQPEEWHNPNDLRSGRRVVDALAEWQASREVTEAEVEAAWSSLLETAVDVTTKEDMRAALEAAREVRS